MPDRPTAGMIVVGILLFAAAILTLALFMIPLRNTWFWSTAGALAVVSAVALAIPLRPKP